MQKTKEISYKRNVSKENIPQYLKEKQSWLAWKLKPKKDPTKKPDKVPMCIRGGYAKSNDPKTWSDFEATFQAFQNNPTFQGIGHVLGDDDIGVDLDKCFDDDGNLTSEAKAIIDRFDSYTEISPSGTGVRIFCRGTMPNNARHKVGHYELYDVNSPRYLTVTGDVIAAKPVESRQDAIDWFIANYLTEAPAKPVAPVESPELTAEEQAELNSYVNPDTVVRVDPVIEEKAELHIVALLAQDYDFCLKCKNVYKIQPKNIFNEYARQLLKVAYMASESGSMPMPADFVELYDKALFDHLADKDQRIKDQWRIQIANFLKPVPETNKPHINLLVSDFAKNAKIKKAVENWLDAIKQGTPDYDGFTKTVAEIAADHSKIERKKDGLTLTQLLTMPPMKYIIADHIGAKDLAVIFGPPGEGKTFTAIDWALSLATGVPLYGQFATVKTPTAYVVSEGNPGGFKNRVQTWIKTHGIAPADNHIYFVPHSFSLVDQASADELVALIQKRLPGCGAVIIDTVARNFAPGDENSTKDMSQFVACCDSIRESLDASVILVHHTGKSKAAAERGSNALRAAVDFSIECNKDDDDPFIKCMPRKCKEFVGKGYVLEMVQEGQSCALKYFSELEKEKANTKKHKPSREELKESVLQVLPRIDEDLETDANTWSKETVAKQVSGLSVRLAGELLGELFEEKKINRSRWGSHGKNLFWVMVNPALRKLGLI